MSGVAILGAGAFGTALAISLARAGTEVALWTRDADQAREMHDQRTNSRRLPGEVLPMAIRVTETLPATADLLLLAIPMQQTAAFLETHRALFAGRDVIGCAKGIDLTSGLGSTGLIARACPDATPAVLTGPSFATDIASGLPTALTLACADAAAGAAMQERLSTSALRLYRTTDVAGAELGGALKNVIAIGAGAVMGAGLGDSARAALMTRGYGEMTRLAMRAGARAETLAGLSGFGDLVLTCTSLQSRNFRYGHALGSGADWDSTTTVEGIATARAMAARATREGVDMPVVSMIVALIDGRVTVTEAAERLLNRPLKEE
ncbi:glycerol-3-phosphate dehydrogenase [Haematobacter missouriensis]|uniref:Glycerol-3-phosphate dehydrogenase [NAD(P)+] n=1 Tax=Haematobacter missouriensis TaxID=366616 RepID=A0A212ARN9_9RHOB|nr:NAD(P)H-dependent glycerol-3-phosphate dehydrogenase [Haematobacter missouriensis]KFI33814.1 glycerol-3-phosphate dehydrogenase [Haematobacter missouriensis]OWJ72263.1 glycerol-3-phosphate dehydrogenase [Haematobacter missouriensis]OWJ84170.1 glycerol-3-phosphate dehydrogenase [Haematobacter missouriensis]